MSRDNAQERYTYHQTGIAMFFRSRKSERSALAPLLELVRSYHGYDRLHFLAELERDAPTVVVLLREMLNEDDERASRDALGLAARSPSNNAPRVPSSSGVSLAHVRPQSTSS